MKGLQVLGTWKDSDGNPICEMFAAANALSQDADVVSQSLYALTEILIRGLMPEERGGGLGGEFGYGVNFENDIFLMHRYCWCEKDDCAWCGGYAGPRFLSPNDQEDDCRAPHFWHKKSGLKIWWYKYIGRGMEMNRESISGQEWHDIFTECIESIPTEAREKAQVEHDHENTPEYRAKAKLQMQAFTKAFFELSAKTPQEYQCWNCKKTWTHPIETGLGTLTVACDECKGRGDD